MLKNIPTYVEYKFIVLNITVMALLTIIASACSDNCEVQRTYTYYEPVYTTLDEVRGSLEVTDAREINQAGKIFFKDGYLFINSPNEGIHIIDNRDPSNPQNAAFINIPGSFDLAIEGNTLFTDSYMDLVALDITDLHDIKEISRLENVFQNYNSYGFYVDDGLGVVTNYVETAAVDSYESECDFDVEISPGFFRTDGMLAVSSIASFDASQAVAPNNPGIGGSMARFALSGQYLYMLDAADVLPIDIHDPDQMLTGSRLRVDWGIETIFARNQNLFLGAQSGMHILGIESPLQPELISTYQHIRSCDPVIVDDNLAYVTLRSGSECAGFTNQLEVINITDLEDPQLLYVYAMDNPHGLGKDGDVLFICDGESGLKIFNAADNSVIGDNMIAHYADIQAFDIIPFNNTAMMIGHDGLYQYDYTDLNNIKFLSHINVTNEGL